MLEHCTPLLHLYFPGTQCLIHTKRSMDSFIHLYSIYQSTSRWRVASHIYSTCSLKWRISLWLAKFIFFIAAVVGFFSEVWWPAFIIMQAVAMLWFWSFSKARSDSYQNIFRLYPKRVKYYEKDYQYIRYIMFREKLACSSFVGSIDDALRHLNDQLETESTSPISSHPFISVSIGAFLAVASGAAGQWGAKTIATVLLSLSISLYFAYVILGITRTPIANLKEFKRFLLWAKEEPV